MYVLNIDPTLLQIGFIRIGWYGLIYALGFVISYFFLRKAVRNGWIKGMDDEKLDSFMVYLILGVVIGSRIFYFVFYDFIQLVHNPAELLMIWHGGMSFHGGLIGTAAACLLFYRKHKINFWKLLDVCAIPAIFALMLGRIGNLINGMLVGTPFDGWWCFVFTKYDSVCRHPYPIYALISHLLLFAYLGVLLYMNKDKARNFFGRGVMSASFFICYGVLRIITDIWKVDDILFGIKAGQWLSIVMVIIGIMIIKKKIINKNN